MNTIVWLQDLANIETSHDALQLINKQQATEIECIIFFIQETQLSILTTNNHQEAYHNLVDVYKQKWYTVNSFFCEEEVFQEALKRYDSRAIKKQEAFQEEQYRLHAEGNQAIELLHKTFEKRASITEGMLLAELLRYSFQAGASDVHFQAEEQWVQMRIRKDGILQSLFVFPHEEFAKYVMKLKFMSGVKMNMLGHSQDWRFAIDIPDIINNKKIDVRSSFLPTLRGESVVLRFLDATKGIATIEQLGMKPWHTTIIEQQLQKHHGLILVAWPTGSWKTTTVYSLLHALNHSDRKIITLEDPVEYEIAGITQSQINESIGYSFEEGLKGVLRHDPDIIMVWEIRSLASAELAVNAAITGHLVISTIHTNSAIEAVTRLLNMWIKPYVLVASLNCVIGQRLVRKAVQPIKKAAVNELDASIMALLRRVKINAPDSKISYDHNIYGQSNSLIDPYTGRVGVFECVVLNDLLKQAILQNKDSIELQKMLDKQWFLSMKDDAYIKMLEQITTIEEIERTI